jgi:hypothetical protein
MRSANPGNVSTAVSEANEERNEPRESSASRAFYTPFDRNYLYD